MLRIKDTECGSTPLEAIETFKQTEEEEPLPSDRVLKYAGADPAKQGIHAVVSKSVDCQHYETDWEVVGKVSDFTIHAKPGPLPGTILVGRTPHPRDGEVGEVIRFTATGIESLFVWGAVRSLPHDWRKTSGAVVY